MKQESSERSGGCLCGGVTYRGRVVPLVLHCHCENCRRLTGNFIGAVRSVTSDLRIEDRDGNLRWYDLGYARYGFCRACGSTLFYQPSADEEITSIAVGTLDDATGLTLKEVWFADEAQPHNPLPAGVPHHEGNA